MSIMFKLHDDFLKFCINLEGPVKIFSLRSQNCLDSLKITEIIKKKHYV